MSDFLLFKIGLVAAGALIAPVATFLVQQEFSEFEEEQTISEPEKGDELVKLPTLKTEQELTQTSESREAPRIDLSTQKQELQQVQRETEPTLNREEQPTQEQPIVQNQSGPASPREQPVPDAQASEITENTVSTPLPAAPQPLKAVPSVTVPSVKKVTLKRRPRLSPQKIQEILKKRRELMAKLGKRPMQSRNGFGNGRIFRAGPGGAMRIRRPIGPTARS